MPEVKNIKIGITGLPGSGKTACLLSVIEILEHEGFVVGGMITEPIIEGSKRVGFYVSNCLTKERDVFAHINLVSDIIVSRYGVNIETLENIGVNALHQAMSTADVIVVDEIGKMEVESEKFVETTRKLLELDNKAIIFTLHKKSRNPLLQEIRRRNDIRLLEVTPVNRNLLPYKIIRLLKGEIL